MIEEGRAEKPSGNAHARPRLHQGPYFRRVRHRGRLAHLASRARASWCSSRKGYALDWLAFADAWRDEYQPAMEEVRSGKIPFSKLDVLHRRNLERILPRFKVSGLDEETMQHLNLAWHRLDGWPDVRRGPAARCTGKFLIAPVLERQHLADGAASRGATISPGMRSSAPRSPATTSRSRASISPSCRGVRLRAARMHDGRGALATISPPPRRTGLKTAHVARPNEHGPGKGEPKPTVPVDIAVGSFTELAEKLGA